MAKRSKKRPPPSREKPRAALSNEREERPTPLDRAWLRALVLVVLVVVIYLPVWHAGYLWDDDLDLTANPCIIGPLGLKEIWTTSAAQFYPLVLTAFWLGHAVWGLAPLPFHLLNVFLHAACAVVLWRVLLALRVAGAWLGAALWAMHPVEVESVAWIAETKNTLSGLFFLLSLLFFIRWLRADREGRTKQSWNYSLTLLFAAFAMASKSSTVILPFILALSAWWMGARGSWRLAGRLAPTFFMAIAAATLALHTVDLQGVNAESEWARSWPERLATAGDAIWFYLGKLVWPHPLVMVYPRWQINAGAVYSYLPLAAAIALTLVLWWKRGSWGRPWFFAWACFVAALLPVLGLVNHLILRYSLVFDHFQYLASMAPLALAGAGMARLTDFVWPGNFWLRTEALGVGLLLILGIISFQRSMVFENQEKLWTDTLAKNPHCWVALNNLGNALLQKGDVEGATAVCEEALAIDPNLDKAHYNLGNASFEKGRLDEAIAQFRQTLALQPNMAEAHYDLGNALSKKGEVNEAVDEYEKALELNPGMAEGHFNLGNLLLQNGRSDEAIAHYRQALVINPRYAEAHGNLGNALLGQGHRDEAEREFREALELDPGNEDAHFNLGLVLGQKGNLTEAVAEFQEAVRLNPRDQDAQTRLNQAETMLNQAPGRR